jgi:16S rRNA (cytosine967-C5)-methyltransferase
MPHQTRPRRLDAENAQPAGLLPRRAALRLLDATLRRGLPLEQALGTATRDVPLPADRALAHSITAGVLRHLPDLDAMIDSATRQPLPDDAKARMVLRLALAQALILETPAHAVIATALPLVDGGPRKLVHGVLGTLLRRADPLPQPPRLPPGVEARWSAAWGDAMVLAARMAIAARPPLDLSLRDAAATDLWAERLGGVSLMPGHVRLPAESDVPALPGFGSGDWWVQDLAASLPARLLGPGDGRLVLDLCAAPGGKTMQLAAAGWRVIAVDQSQRRTERMRDNLARTGLAASVVRADIAGWQPDEPADAILLDAPCSATGIFRRHPDVLHRIGARQIAELAEVQAALLDRACGWLKPGGRLVYATCSLEPQEGEAQIAALLARRPDMRPLAIATPDLPANIAPAPVAVPAAPHDAQTAAPGASDPAGRAVLADDRPAPTQGTGVVIRSDPGTAPTGSHDMAAGAQGMPLAADDEPVAPHGLPAGIEGLPAAAGGAPVAADGLSADTAPPSSAGPVAAHGPAAGIEGMCAAAGGTPGQPIGADGMPHRAASDAPATLRTLPGTLAGAGGLDGFFMALLVRAGAD